MKQFSKDLGNVSLAPKGRWSKEQEYERLNLVYNACDNLSYVAKIDVPIGVEIDNREYWQPMNATGYADNNFINLTTENENGTITAYETLEEAVATILPINRRPGATLSFFNLNADRLDRQAEFELWQFNSTDLANWENRDYWNNIYYNWNVFAGWYIGADALKNHVKIPNVGQYAYVGTNLNDALLYQCRTNGTWTNTGIKVRNYISIVVSGNISIGKNGNWFSNGEDTGIPATPAVDEQLDNIIMQLQQHTIEINNLKASDVNLQDQITSNDSDITNLTAKHESLSRIVQGIAATGGASTANNVTYNNDASGLNAENAQDAIDEVSSMVIYDVSARNNGAVFESLSALLSSSNLDTLIPTSVRHGGMNIRFVQGSVYSSDNKYVQYRYMGTATTGTPNPFLDEANWQGVDDEPTAGSDNLVKSGGVFNVEDSLNFNIGEVEGVYVFKGIEAETVHGINYVIKLLPVNYGDRLKVTVISNGVSINANTLQIKVRAGGASYNWITDGNLDQEYTYNSESTDIQGLTLYVAGNNVITPGQVILKVEKVDSSLFDDIKLNSSYYIYFGGSKNPNIEYINSSTVRITFQANSNMRIKTKYSHLFIDHTFNESESYNLTTIQCLYLNTLTDEILVMSTDNTNTNIRYLIPLLGIAYGTLYGQLSNFYYSDRDITLENAKNDLVTLNENVHVADGRFSGEFVFNDIYADTTNGVNYIRRSIPSEMFKYGEHWQLTVVSNSSGGANVNENSINLRVISGDVTYSLGNISLGGTFDYVVSTGVITGFAVYIPSSDVTTTGYLTLQATRVYGSINNIIKRSTGYLAVFNNNNNPSFEKLYGYQIKITLPTDIEIKSVNGPVLSITQSTSGYESEYTLNSYQGLFYNASTNSLETHSFSDSILLSTELIMLFGVYGNSYYGVLANCYFSNKILENTNAIEQIQPSVPSYFTSNVNQAIEKIKDNMAEVGMNGESFVFISDIHWDGNTKHSPSLIREILNKTNVKDVLCTGDLINQGEKAEMASTLIACMKAFTFDAHPMITTRGNHDDNSNFPDEQVPTYEFTFAQYYSYWMKPMDGFITYLAENNCSFYYDKPTTKTRYIFVDTERHGTISGSSQVVPAICELLNTVEEGWHVVFIYHIYKYSENYSPGLGAVAISTIADAYNARSNDTPIPSYAITPDFSNANGNCVAIFAGHMHVDASYTTPDGIPIILIDTDCRNRSNNTDYPFVEGTVTEQAFDVITIDYVNKTIKCVRVGAGIDREFSY